NAWLFRRLTESIEQLFSKIPLIKILYSSIKDISRFASASEGREESRTAVLVQLSPDLQVIGFVTDRQVRFVDGESRCAVYLPLSYQIGGFTVLMPASKLTPLNLPADQAMRYVVTAGMTQFDATTSGKAK